MAYLISEPVIDHLLEIAQRAHAKAVGTAFWPLVKDEPIVIELMNAFNALDREAKHAQAPEPWENRILRAQGDTPK